MLCSLQTNCLNLGNLITARGEPRSNLAIGNAANPLVQGDAQTWEECASCFHTLRWLPLSFSCRKDFGPRMCQFLRRDLVSLWLRTKDPSTTPLAPKESGYGAE